VTYDILNRRNGAASLRRPVMPPSGTLLVFGGEGGGRAVSNARGRFEASLPSRSFPG